jgi:hypothetical protein
VHGQSEHCSVCRSARPIRCPSGYTIHPVALSIIAIGHDTDEVGLEGRPCDSVEVTRLFLS